ncbi:MAG: hypothetical protein IJ668_01695 [Selenomonadaceae bacterium]|nr:hypothetical protein [Selenomonadaceae bacterium]
MAVGINGVNGALNTLNNVQTASQNTIQRIATGSRFPNAASGASQYAISQRMYNNIGSIAQSNQNTQNVGAMLRTAAGAAHNTVQALGTIRGNIINAANGSNTAVDRQNLRRMVEQHIQQIDNNAAVEYNRQRLLDGTRNVAVAGIAGYDNVRLNDLSSRGLGLTNDRGEININFDNDEGIRDALNRVDNALSVARGTNTTIETAIEDLGFESALDVETTIGAQQQRLEYQASMYTTMEENELNAVSTISDSNIAQEMINLRTERAQEQLALFATQMFNQNRASILNLIGAQ